ncbi:MAG: diaminopimelate epimerase [Planctomycetes bacterium]|nr:diaminopimelate epimerase [Planctomycetota bacterium]
MPLRFTKMHGLGNDYVYVELFSQTVADPASLARAVSDRHRGVGSDGLILIAPPDGADAHVRMIMFNADGSRAQMCGNGVRCVAKYAYDHRLARANPMRVQTDRGVLVLDLATDESGLVRQVRVDMGAPILDPRKIPVARPGAQVVAARMDFGGLNFETTCVSMGNPHAVIYVDDLAAVPLADWGPRIERSPLFPERVNVHFVRVESPTHARMITWERGTGPTQACGTGASAVGVAGVLTRRTQRQLTASLPGGDLLIEWNESDGHVFMTGPATEVFSGVWPDGLPR